MGRRHPKQNPFTTMKIPKPHHLLYLSTLLVLLIYSNILNAPFVFDDNIYIRDNPLISNLENFLSLSGTRYITLLTFALNYWVNGYSTFGYHLVNILIHVFNTWLVFGLIMTIFSTPVMEGYIKEDRRVKFQFLAITIATLFAVHPVQVQAVTYITQRFASLATFFYLLSILTFIRARLCWSRGDGKGWVFYILSILSAILSQKTKEISFTLPFVIAICEFIFFSSKDGLNRRGRLLYLLPFVLLLPIIPVGLFGPEIGILRKGAGIEEEIRSLQVQELVSLSRYEYLLTQFRVIMTYLRLLVLPVGQNLLYDYPHYRTILDIEVILSILFVATLLTWSVYLFRRSRRERDPYGLIVSFSVFWFFITISVESSIIPIKDVIFEHRLYLPSVGAFTVMGAVFFYLTDSALIGDRTRRFVRLITVIVVVSVFSLATYLRNEVWKDDVTLWQDVARKSPALAKAQNNLGDALMKKGRYDEAIKALGLAVKADPWYVEPHYNLGICYLRKGLLRKAISEFKEVIRINSILKEGHYGARTEPKYEFQANLNLGNIYFLLGEFGKAVEYLKKAVSINPSDLSVHFNLGLAYKRLGMFSKAEEEFRRVLEIDPSDRGAMYNLMIMKNNRGQTETEK